MKHFAALLSLMVFLAPMPALADNKVLQSINTFRASKGLNTVAVHPKLQSIAEAHASEMAKHNFFSHRGRNGSTPGKRARRAGYRYCVIAENIGKGYRTANAAVEGWQESPAHRKNMSHRKIREVGIAQTGDIWVLVMAARRC